MFERPFYPGAAINHPWDGGGRPPPIWPNTARALNLWSRMTAKNRETALALIREKMPTPESVQQWLAVVERKQAERQGASGNGNGTGG